MKNVKSEKIEKALAENAAGERDLNAALERARQERMTRRDYTPVEEEEFRSQEREGCAVLGAVAVAVGVIVGMSVWGAAMVMAWLNRVAWPAGWVLTGAVATWLVGTLVWCGWERWRVRRMWRRWERGTRERMERERRAELLRLGSWKEEGK